MKRKEAKFNNLNYQSVGRIDIKELKELTEKSRRNKFRLCLHKKTSDLVQEMIICTKNFVYSQPHKHPNNKSESYHIIEGSLDVIIFNDKGKVIDKIYLSSFKNKNSQFMYRLSKPYFHTMIPRSKWTIWHEVSTGPFTKKKNQFAKYADFAPSENSKKIEINSFINKIKKITFKKIEK